MKEKNAFLLISKYRGAIMGFAALWIFFFHEWITLAPSDSVLAFPEAFLKRIGFCGVDIFLLLSAIRSLFFLIRSVFCSIREPVLFVLLILCTFVIIRQPHIQGWRNDVDFNISRQARICSQRPRPS